MTKLSPLILFVCLATAGAQEKRIVAVDTEDVVGSWTSLALDDLVYPHIAYQKTNPDCELRYAYWDGAQWVIEVIDDEGFPGKYTSLALDSQGRPHISYFAEDPVDMRYAHWDGAAWQSEQVTTDLQMGLYSSLVLDENDNPVISYFDAGGLDLNFLWTNSPPPPFSLLDPKDGSIFETWPEVSWEEVVDFPAVGYALLCSTEPDFATYDEITGLDTTSYTFSSDELVIGPLYYWKVQAWQSSSSFWSAETWSFTVPPDLSTLEAELTSTLDDDGVLLSWTVEGGSPAAVRLLSRRVVVGR